eukprot:323229_1
MSGLGYWGSVDASWDWCEPNYVHSYYIAEFWNTLSSVPMILIPIFGMVMCYTSGVKQIKFMIPFVLTTCIGMGSVAFHGTLRRFSQLLDEIPMLIWLYFVFYTVINIKPIKRRRQTKTNLSGTILLIICILHVVIYTILEWYYIFAITYIILVLVASFYGGRLIWADFQYYNATLKVYILMLCVFVFTFVLWNIENSYCSYVQPFNFHVLWHLSGGYTFYMVDLGVIFMRGHYLKLNPKLKLKIIHYTQWDVV